MIVIASAEFRKSYASLTEPVVVKAKGRTLGTWTPGRPAVIPEPVAAPVVAHRPTRWPGGVIGGRA